MRSAACQPCEARKCHGILPTRGCSEAPALRVAHQEVAEDLHARNRLELLGINEKSVDRGRVGFTEQLHQATVLLDQIVRQQRDADAALAGAHTPRCVDGQNRRPRAFAVAPHPVARSGLQIVGTAAAAGRWVVVEF